MAKESYARGTVRPLFCKARNVSEAFPVVAAAIIVKPVDVSGKMQRVDGNVCL